MREANALRSKGLEVKCEDLGDCVACYYKKGEELYTIVIKEGLKGYFAKVVPFHKLPPAFTCSSAFLVPYGLYAFAEDLDELADKVKEKLELVRTSSD
ncbi:hypothetical protein [Ignicoccus hospitalis]|uniref:Uncharacterized protein n=1 Tax=Ignicoccus hospitalis (strain KIN4/I / DSM 18386 / JCM 14125) TaxID=453591 RepID=A8A8P5_IGNH4|nr:hypothetical protein [Ignicoccus hospitalis]ABU81297.1 hypothetical protein Igni_0113 [Ignicoccus hospitalis KIN4/I]HIH90399.1 hypothetical protein [Desulfurococcaceae archaeon]